VQGIGATGRTDGEAWLVDIDGGFDAGEARAGGRRRQRDGVSRHARRIARASIRRAKVRAGGDEHRARGVRGPGPVARHTATPPAAPAALHAPPRNYPANSSALAVGREGLFDNPGDVGDGQEAVVLSNLLCPLGEALREGGRRVVHGAEAAGRCGGTGAGLMGSAPPTAGHNGRGQGEKGRPREARCTAGRREKQRPFTPHLSRRHDKPRHGELARPHLHLGLDLRNNG